MRVGLVGDDDVGAVHHPLRHVAMQVERRDDGHVGSHDGAHGGRRSRRRGRVFSVVIIAPWLEM